MEYLSFVSEPKGDSEPIVKAQVRSVEMIGIAQKLIELGNAQEMKELTFAENKEADQLILSDPFAFLLAVIFDQMIVAERAWTVPHLLWGRLGHLDVVQIARMDPVNFERIIRINPALHRFPAKMAKWVISAAQRVERQYGGDAGRIWNDNPRASDLQNRFDEFDGISQKKASMAANILVRDRQIPVSDRQGIDVSYDVQVRRVFLRAGLVAEDTEEAIIGVARELNPDYPGALDLAAWYIGRNHCRPRDPRCHECPLGNLCPKIGQRETVLAE